MTRIDQLVKTLQTLKSGGKIHIKKENRGKFTKSAKAAGEGVQEHAHKVMNDPNATPLQKKRANFAIQAKKWHKHQSGGIIPGSGSGGGTRVNNVDTVNPYRIINNTKYVIHHYPHRNPQNIGEDWDNFIGFLRSIPMSQSQIDSLEWDRQMRENIARSLDMPTNRWVEFSPTWRQLQPPPYGPIFDFPPKIKNDHYRTLYKLINPKK